MKTKQNKMKMKSDTRAMEKAINWQLSHRLLNIKWERDDEWYIAEIQGIKPPETAIDVKNKLTSEEQIPTINIRYMIDNVKQSWKHFEDYCWCFTECTYDLGYIDQQIFYCKTCFVQFCAHFCVVCMCVC